MATYVMTGGASGIGAATRTLLTDQGGTVITLDLQNADFNADLGDVAARSTVIDTVRRAHPSIDGLITCAGVASHFPDPAKILAINYFGTRGIIEGLADCLLPGGRIVAISSNSAPMCHNEALIKAMLDNNPDQAFEMATASNGHECYAGSKQAVARWMRRVAPEYARRGIAFNAVAPGYIETPMTQAVAQSEEYGDAIRDFVDSIPIGRSGQPEDVAQLAQFLLSPAAGFMTGNVVFIDGGHDALFRPESV